MTPPGNPGQPNKTIEQLDQEIEGLEQLKNDVAEDLAAGKITAAEAELTLQGINQEIERLTNQIIDLLGGGANPIP